MKIHLDSPEEEARIELIPLIDVIFCILTFFLLAALQLTRQQAISVDLPKASTGQPQMREMMVVSLDTFGQIYIDQIPVTPPQLDQVLQKYQTRNPGGLMVLYAPKDAKYNDVVQILDRMRLVGGDRVALATLPSGAAPPSPNPTPGNPGLNAPPNSNPGSGNLFPRAVPPTAPSTPNLYQIPSPQGQNPNLPPQAPGGTGTMDSLPPLTPTPGLTPAPSQLTPAPGFTPAPSQP
jgi:biopolymer transport protein ExbD